jgi:2'-5' RNA ligase
MADKALYVLAGYDDQTEERLSGIQNRLYERGFSGIQTKGIPMHFTMGSYDTGREEELKARLGEIAETHGAFSTSFNHVGLFRLPQNDVLFIAPEVSREMLLLKERFADNQDRFPWSPHTTLLIDRPETVQQAIPAVLEEFVPFAGKVTVLHLYEFWPTRHILSVHLK